MMCLTNFIVPDLTMDDCASHPVTDKTVQATEKTIALPMPSASGSDSPQSFLTTLWPHYDASLP